IMDGSVSHARKTYLTSENGLKVPMRAISLTNGESVRLYETSGPYTDPSYEVDVERGLPALRSDWIIRRGDTAAYEGRAVRPADDGRATGPARTPARSPRRAGGG